MGVSGDPSLTPRHVHCACCVVCVVSRFAFGRHGAALIAENDEYLNEMISSMSMGRPDARPAMHDSSPLPIERTYSADSFGLEVCLDSTFLLSSGPVGVRLVPVQPPAGFESLVFSSVFPSHIAPPAMFLFWLCLFLLFFFGQRVRAVRSRLAAWAARKPLALQATLALIPSDNQHGQPCRILCFPHTLPLHLKTKRQEALEAADSAWKQEKSELETRIEASGYLTPGLGRDLWPRLFCGPCMRPWVQRCAVGCQRCASYSSMSIPLR